MSDRNEKRCGKECGFVLKAQRKIIRWKVRKKENKVGVSGGCAQVGGRTFLEEWIRRQGRIRISGSRPVIRKTDCENCAKICAGR